MPHLVRHWCPAVVHDKTHRDGRGSLAAEHSAVFQVRLGEGCDHSHTATFGGMRWCRFVLDFGLVLELRREHASEQLALDGLVELAVGQPTAPAVNLIASPAFGIADTTDHVAGRECPVGK